MSCSNALSGGERSPFIVRRSLSQDAVLISGRLRQADLAEIRASTLETPLEVLERGIATSQPCYTALDALEQVTAVFGVVPCEDGHGLIWLLGTDDLSLGRVAVVRRGLAIVEELQQTYPVLYNWVDARNNKHLRWLLWCGFQIVGANPAYGVEQRRFFELRRMRR